MALKEKEIQAVLELPSEQRYRYFIQRIVDTEIVWGLFDDGWALAEDSNGIGIFPLWPASEYAQLCAKDDWVNYKPESFSIEELVDTLLPKMKENNVLPGIFYTPDLKSIIPDIDLVISDIQNEQERY
jgi:hypothetical protein